MRADSFLSVRRLFRMNRRFVSFDVKLCEGSEIALITEKVSDLCVDSFDVQRNFSFFSEGFQADRALFAEIEGDDVMNGYPGKTQLYVESSLGYQLKPTLDNRRNFACCFHRSQEISREEFPTSFDSFQLFP
jgi:hypothetical protein